MPGNGLDLAGEVLALVGPYAPLIFAGAVIGLMGYALRRILYAVEFYDTKRRYDMGVRRNRIVQDAWDNQPFPDD